MTARENAIESRPVKPVIAILEDNADRVSAMSHVAHALLPDFDIYQTDDANTMVDWLKEHLLEVAVISLDHDLPIERDADGKLVDHGDGMAVANYLAGQLPVFPVIVHTSNSSAGDQMVRVLRKADWPVERVRPFDSSSWVGREWQAQLQSLADRFLVSAM